MSSKSLQNQQQSLHRRKLGIRGEDYACSYLQKQGYTLLDRNFKGRYGELDIVVRNATTTVFVEVKTRSGVTFGFPQEAVTPRKFQEVIQTAEYYMLKHPTLPKAMRVDVIAIIYDDTEHVTSFDHIVNVTM